MYYNMPNNYDYSRMDDSQNLPQIEVISRSGFELNTAQLQRFAEAARIAILAQPVGECEPVLQEITELVVIFIDDPEMAELHEQFSGVHGTTDVLTFQHGEIVISAETAAAYARENGIPFTEELCRYIVHGLLHLHGYDDRNAESRNKMHQLQEQLLEQIVI